MATRREQLAAALGEGESPAAAAAGESPERPAAAPAEDSEGGFPFAVLQGSGGVAEPPVFVSRVKAPEDKAEKKPKETPRRAGTASERQLEEIRDSLLEKTDQVAGLIAGVTPVTSVYLAENSPRAVAALVNIGKRRPGLLKHLAKVADGIDGVEVGKFLLGTLTALQVDFGRLQPDAMPARVFGVTQIIEEHFGNPEERPNPAVMFQAPQYVPV